MKLSNKNITIITYYYYFRSIGLMSRVFTNGPGDRGSIPGRLIPKTQKMVLDAALLSTRHYKMKIEGKVEQSCEWYSSYWKGNLQVTLD